MLRWLLSKAEIGSTYSIWDSNLSSITLFMSSANTLSKSSGEILFHSSMSVIFSVGYSSLKFILCSRCVSYSVIIDFHLLVCIYIFTSLFKLVHSMTFPDIIIIQ